MNLLLASNRDARQQINFIKAQNLLSWNLHCDKSPESCTSTKQSFQLCVKFRSRVADCSSYRGGKVVSGPRHKPLPGSGMKASQNRACGYGLTRNAYRLTYLTATLLKMSSLSGQVNHDSIHGP
jgi:hypothetical protein